mmetsp:Transcript_40926/g.127318  ORF Transcript_40926/g.127318 Transcript_40926/m.127318 type:complete len:219 (+) Transcript_40926:265-921(+)
MAVPQELPHHVLREALHRLLRPLLRAEGIGVPRGRSQGGLAGLGDIPAGVVGHPDAGGGCGAGAESDAGSGGKPHEAGSRGLGGRLRGVAPAAGALRRRRRERAGGRLRHRHLPVPGSPAQQVSPEVAHRRAPAPQHLPLGPRLRVPPAGRARAGGGAGAAARQGAAPARGRGGAPRPRRHQGAQGRCQGGRGPRPQPPRGRCQCPSPRRGGGAAQGH